MKHITLLLLLILLGIGCKKIDKLTHFYMNYQTKCVLDQTIIFSSPFDILSDEISTLKDSILIAEQTDEGRVSQIDLKKLTLTVENMDSIPNGYFQSIEVYLLGVDKSDKLIAWNDNINDNEYTPFNLTLTTDDLSSYIMESTIRYRIRGNLTGLHKLKVNMHLETQYFVNAAIHAK